MGAKNTPTSFSPVTSTTYESGPKTFLLLILTLFHTDVKFQGYT